MGKQEIIARLARRVAQAAAPLGMSRQDVGISTKGITLPAFGIEIETRLKGDARFWVAYRKVDVRQLADGDEQSVRQMLFAEPLAAEWAVARNVAMVVAEARIDAAIDSAV